MGIYLPSLYLQLIYAPQLNLAIILYFLLKVFNNIRSAENLDQEHSILQIFYRLQFIWSFDGQTYNVFINTVHTRV